MALGNFGKVMPRVLAHEGGFVNDPHDPGGATKYGITARTLGAWRHVGVANSAQVNALGVDEAIAIYRAQYAAVLNFDQLPSGVDYAVLDYGINSGVKRAAQELQRIVGAQVDGHLGLETVNAAHTMPPAVIVNKLCDARLAFLRRLPNWKRYGAGWSRRVAEVRGFAVMLAQQPIAAPPVPQPRPEPVRPVPALPPPDPAPDVPAPVPDFPAVPPVPAEVDLPPLEPAPSAGDVATEPPSSPVKGVVDRLSYLGGGGGISLFLSQVAGSPYAPLIFGGAAAVLLVLIVLAVVLFRESIRRRIEAIK